MCQSGWTKDAQLPIWFLFDETDNDSSEQFLQILAWSFKALQQAIQGPSRQADSWQTLAYFLGPEQFPVVWQVFWVAHNIFLLSGMFLVAEQFCAFWQLFSWHGVFSTMFQPRYSKGSAEAKLANTALAAGYKGMCWSLVGDMEYLCQRLHLPQERTMCPLQMHWRRLRDILERLQASSCMDNPPADSTRVPWFFQIFLRLV